MLAQSPPRSLFAPDSGMGSGLGMDMDFSPSQLVSHPARARAHDSQHFDIRDFEVHNQRAGDFMQASPLDHSLFLQSPFNFGGSTFSSQSYLNPDPSSSMMPLLHPSHFVRLSGPASGQAINPRALLPPLTIGEGMTDTGPVSMKDLSQPSSSSPSSENHPQTMVFSRRSDGVSGSSPKSAPADALLFCRTANPGARQRTAQACEKCRDRKTKCSGVRPTCKRCADRGLACVWAPETRVRGPSRQPRQRRESVTNTGEPLSALSVPFSAPGSRESSPYPSGQDIVYSAPAAQTTFPTVAQPSHLLMRSQQKRQSWQQGAFYTGAVAKGLNALNVMGEPIRPLTSVDDCWYPVGSAKVETPSRERSGTTRVRERRSSVSVAHLARAHELRNETQPLPEMHEPGFFDTINFDDAPSAPHYNGERSNDSSPPPLGESGPTSSSDMSDNEPTLSLPELHHMHAGEHELHQPFPTYDTASQLSDEMMKLLNFPGDPIIHASGNDFGFFAGAHSFADAAHDNVGAMADQVTPLAMPQHAKENEDELIAQYLNTDAFDKMQD